MKKLFLISALVLSLAIVGSAQAQAKKEAPVAKKEVAAPVVKKAVKKGVKKGVVAPSVIAAPAKPAAPAKK